MIPVLSRSQARALDRALSEQCGVPGLVLMENAGRAAAEIIERGLPSASSALILCGTGNNGGDGFVVARRLRTRGFAVTLLLAGAVDRLKGDAFTNYEMWRGIGGTVAELGDTQGLAPLEQALPHAAAVVDALFGTGLEREVRGQQAAILETVNGAQVPRYALDVPSGLHADTGESLGVALRADETITFAALKLGLLTSNGARHAGRVHLVDIGVPLSLSDRVGKSAELVESADVRRVLWRRPVDAHKGSAGRVLALSGSAGKAGAGFLVARGALRTGAGLVTVAGFGAALSSPPDLLEAMTSELKRDDLEANVDQLIAGKDVVVVGPGFGTDADARSALERVLATHSGPCVLDADALSLLSGRLESLRAARGPCILTPHPAEAGRLLGCTTSAIESDRFGAVERLVELTASVVLLKGPRSLIGAPGQTIAINASGTPAMATAGAGDVLAGIIAALAALLEPRWAALAGAHLHGLAGERWVDQHATEAVTGAMRARPHSNRGADRGLLAHELADGVPDAIAGLADARPALPV